MENLTSQEISQMTKQEIVERFNILVDVMEKAVNEIRSIECISDLAFLAGQGSAKENEEYNKKLRAVLILRRPFASTMYCEYGVKALSLPTT